MLIRSFLDSSGSGGVLTPLPLAIAMTFSNEVSMRLVVVFIGALWCFGLGTACAGDLSNVDVPTVIEHVHESEQRLVSVYVEAETHMDEALASEHPAWKETLREMQVRASFNGALGGPYRLEMLRNVVPWHDGPKGKSPYANDVTDTSFDGTREVAVTKAGGHVDEPFDPREAVITSGGTSGTLPELLLSTGAMFTSGFAHSERGKPLSEFLKDYCGYLKKNADLQPICQLSQESFHGYAAVKLVMGYSGRLENSWWFAPECGWALVGAEHVEGKNHFCKDRFVVTSLKQVAPDIWYPETAEYELLNPDQEKKVQRYRFALKKVVANSPEVEKHMKGGGIPVGTTVTDKIEGKVYETAPADKDMQKQIEADLQKAAQAATQATGGK